MQFTVFTPDDSIVVSVMSSGGGPNGEATARIPDDLPDGAYLVSGEAIGITPVFQFFVRYPRDAAQEKLFVIRNRQWDFGDTALTSTPSVPTEHLPGVDVFTVPDGVEQITVTDGVKSRTFTMVRAFPYVPIPTRIELFDRIIQTEILSVQPSESSEGLTSIQVFQGSFSEPTTAQTNGASLPTKLAETQVLINGEPMEIQSVSSRELTVKLPCVPEGEMDVKIIPVVEDTEGTGIILSPSLSKSLHFAHMGDGEFGAFRFKTNFMLLNTTDQSVSGRLELFSNEGLELSVRIGETTASDFSFEIPPGGTLHLDTDGSGPLKNGWARVMTDIGIQGTASFMVHSSAGAFVSDVGVASSSLLPNFSIFVDTSGESDTGVALANPYNQDTFAEAVLFDASGSEIARNVLLLPRRGHLSKFVTEIFSSVPNIDEFIGSVRFFSIRQLAALTLRTNGLHFTSLPVVP